MDQWVIMSLTDNTKLDTFLSFSVSTGQADSNWFSSTTTVHIIYLYAPPRAFSPRAQMKLFCGHDCHAYDPQICGRLTHDIFH